MGLRIDKDRRRLDYDLRLDDDRTRPTPAPAPSPRSPATSGADNDDPVAVKSAVTTMKSAVANPAASPGEARCGRNQQNHDHQERDDRCLFHGYTTTNQPRPRTYIVSIPEGYQEFPVIPVGPPRPASLRT